MPVGVRVGQGIQRRRQQVRQFGKQRPEGSRDRAELVRETNVGCAAERLDHRAERKRLTKRLAVADERAPILEARQREQLAYEPGLPDTGLALDDGDRGRTQCRAEQAGSAP